MFEENHMLRHLEIQQQRPIHIIRECVDNEVRYVF